jgi:hypothetical protein
MVILRNLLAAALLLPCLPASAQTTWDVFSKLGMSGVRASSCTRPAAPDNWYLTYEKGENGTVIRRADRGPGLPELRSVVDRAEQVGATLVKARYRNDGPDWGPSNGEWYDLTILIEGARYRTWTSVASDGRVLIKDGVFTGNNQQSPWSEKCRD